MRILSYDITTQNSKQRLLNKPEMLSYLWVENSIQINRALRRHNWMHFAHRPQYCYNEFNLSYFNNLKLFSLRVKELLEPKVL